MSEDTAYKLENKAWEIINFCPDRAIQTFSLRRIYREYGQKINTEMSERLQKEEIGRSLRVVARIGRAGLANA